MPIFFKSLAIRLCVLPLSSLFFCQSLRAADFANCSKSNDQVKAAKEPLSDTSRLRDIEILVNEFRTVLEEGAKPRPEVPKGHITFCLKTKREAIDENIRLSSSSLKASPAYLRAIASYSLLLGQREAAYTGYLKAAEKDPKDFSSRQKAFSVWIDQKLSSFKQIGAKNLTDRDINEFFDESDRILAPLIKNTSVPVDIRISAIQTRAQMTEDFFGDFSKALKDWKLIIDLDAQNKNAITQIYAFETKRGNISEARKYGLLLSKLSPSSWPLHASLIQVLIESKDWEELRRLTTEKRKTFKDKVQVHSSLARAMIELKLSPSEAESINQVALKLNSKDKLAIKNQVDLLLQKADSQLQLNQIGPALATLNQARRLDKNNFMISQKLAFVIFDSHQDQVTTSAKAKTTDMKIIVSLLEPALSFKETEAQVLRVLITAAHLSRKNKQGSIACSRHDREFGTLPNLDLVFSCAEIYSRSNNKTAAKQLLQNSLNDSRFSGSKQKISEKLMRFL